MTRASSRATSTPGAWLAGYASPRRTSRPTSSSHSPECREGAFSEVGLPLYGVLRSSRRASVDGIMLVMERGGPWGSLQAGREGESDAQDAQSKAARAAPVRDASGVRAVGHGAGVDEPRRFGARRERGGSGGDRRFGDPGARREAWQDRALGDRGARGRTAARQGAGRRAGAKAGGRTAASSSFTSE